MPIFGKVRMRADTHCPKPLQEINDGDLIEILETWHESCLLIHRTFTSITQHPDGVSFMFIFSI